jgi:hypothetical protein
VADKSKLLAEAFGLAGQQGAIVAEVMADSPASEAGLMPGDIVVSINGGEPLLRNDICDIVRQVRLHVMYVALITNAGLLTLEKAHALKEAGLDQLTISLDYLDERHDKVRGIPGLFKRISGLVPQIRNQVLENIVLNTIIMDSNLDDVVTIAKQAHEWGIKVSFSAYSANKADNDTEVIHDDKQEKLKAVGYHNPGRLHPTLFGNSTHLPLHRMVARPVRRHRLRRMLVCLPRRKPGPRHHEAYCGVGKGVRGYEDPLLSNYFFTCIFRFTFLFN